METYLVLLNVVSSSISLADLCDLLEMAAVYR